MKKFKSVVPIVSVSLLALMAYYVVLFLIVDNRTSNFWVGVLFVLLSWGCLIIEGLTLFQVDKPWVVSDVLIDQARNAAFWNNEYFPVFLKRLRQIISANELKGVFKLPIDDEQISGVKSNRIAASRERLHDSIISDDNFKLGVLQNSISKGGEPLHVGISVNDFTKHALIVGMPGSGKTNFALGMLIRLWRDFGVPFLVVEPTESEYRSLIDAIPNLRVFTPGKSDVAPFPINPFVPPDGVTVEGYIPSLMEAFKAAFSMPSPLPDIFMSAINDCYNEYGWKKSSKANDEGVRWFGLYEFIKVFKKKINLLDYKGDVKSNFESAGVVRLVSMLEQNSSIYDTVNAVPISDLIRHPTIIELNAINNQEQKALIMALILIAIYVHTKNNVPSDGKLKNVLMIDEAHVLLSGGGIKQDYQVNAQGTTIEALENMIAEIRSYGTSVVISDQSPIRMGRNIIANTNLKVSFRLVETENRSSIKTSTNMNDAQFEMLGRLSVGEAFIHHGKVDEPLLIRTYNVHDIATIRNVVMDDELKPHLTYWDDHKMLLIPFRECQYCNQCDESCNDSIREEAEHISIRLVNSILSNIKTKEDFVKLLVNLDSHINEVYRTDCEGDTLKRLANCVKIHFLRKALLTKDYGITNDEYEKIIRHQKFLKGEKDNG